MSQTARTIIKNTAWLGLAEVLNGVLMFFLTVWLARYLSTQQYGQLSFAINLTTLGSLFVDFGLSTLMIREVARDKTLAPTFLHNIIALRLVLGVVFLAVMFGISTFSNQEPLITQLVMLTGVSAVLNALILTLAGVFRSFERMQYEAMGRIAVSVCLAALGIYFITSQRSLVWFGWLYVLSSLVGVCVVAWIVGRRFTPIALAFTFNFWKYLIREAWPLALSLVFISVYYYMDSVMLGFMGQATAVGWYNADYKVILFALLFAGILANVFFPLISRLYKESLERLKDLLTDFSKLMITLALPIGLGGVMLAQPLIEWIYGPDYLGGVTAFRILIWTAVIVYISVVFGNSIQACDRQKVYVRGVAIGAAVNVILNFLLIPRWSLNGAAAATLAAEVTVFVYMYIQLRRIVRVPLLVFLWRPLLAGIGMVAALWALASLHVIVLVGVGILVYSTILIAVRGVTQREVDLFKNIIFSKFKSS